MTIKKLTIYAYYGAQFVLETAEKDYENHPSEETWQNLKNAEKDHAKIKQLFNDLRYYNDQN